MASEPQRQPWPRLFKAHIVKLIKPIVDLDQATTKEYVDNLDKAGILANAAFIGLTVKKATVTFNTPFPDNNYVVVVTGENARTWTIESKTANGFVISSNSVVVITANTFWYARRTNDP